MDTKRNCGTCWFREADGTNWFTSKNAMVKPKPGQEWCTLNNGPCPASRICSSWMTTAGSKPIMDGSDTVTKQEAVAAKKEKRRLRKLAKKALTETK